MGSVPMMNKNIKADKRNDRGMFVLYLGIDGTEKVITETPYGPIKTQRGGDFQP